LRLWIAVQNGGSAPEKIFCIGDWYGEGNRFQGTGDRFQVMLQGWHRYPPRQSDNHPRQYPFDWSCTTDEMMLFYIIIGSIGCKGAMHCAPTNKTPPQPSPNSRRAFFCVYSRCVAPFSGYVLNRLRPVRSIQDFGCGGMNRW
jgi:hypothetical protein